MKATLVLMVIASMMTVLCAVDTSKPFHLTTLLGEKYKNCRITRATPEGLTVVHDGGVARISFTALDQEWREMFDYDPVKAREFAEAEEAKRKIAQEQRAEMERKRQVNEREHLDALAAMERKRIEDEARVVKEYEDGVKAANAPAVPLAPLPGDATPNLSVPPSQPAPSQPVPSEPIMYTEVVVPTVMPVGDPYTPSKIRSRSYFYSDGFYGGYPYGFYQPIFGHPGCGHHFTPCPSSSIIPGVQGMISNGGFSIHVGH